MGAEKVPGLSVHSLVLLTGDLGLITFSQPKRAHRSGKMLALQDRSDKESNIM